MNEITTSIDNTLMRASIGIFLNYKELYDGDIVAQHCKMVDDFTGKTSVQLNRLLICWNGKSWDVKCIDAMVGYKNNFWGYIPKIDELVGNAVDNADWLRGGCVWQPYTHVTALHNPTIQQLISKH